MSTDNRTRRSHSHRPKMALVMPATKQIRMTPDQALTKAMNILLTAEGAAQVQELAKHFSNPNQNTGASA